jgi:hypothetical protein
MKKSVTVRSLAQADPDYAKALELRASLRSKRDALDSEENRIRERLANDRASPAGETAAVAALLGDVAVDAEAPAGPLARLTAITRERADLRRALEVAESRLQKSRFKASSAICAEVAPTYKEHVRALAAALVGAHSAHETLLSLIGDLNAKDVAWTAHLEPMHANNIFGHNSGKLGAWLHSAKRADFIDMIPKGLEQ